MLINPNIGYTLQNLRFRQRIRRHFYRFPVEISMAKTLGLYDNT